MNKTDCLARERNFDCSRIEQNAKFRGCLARERFLRITSATGSSPDPSTKSTLKVMSPFSTD